ncbi:G2/mitotic-specific cyclin-B-like protein [Leptotrombidium deliense]|uniref:G2/mitotic-specific cyclin-B-like protein n=1 Tax=Leptotrombidium deliense TaxID=299467 RepID=A0A443SNV3_9ACAR|nr:G2/mitotic-specific cyclin-B-like protein [Leptotrombidium deliense]
MAAKYTDRGLGLRIGNENKIAKNVKQAATTTVPVKRPLRSNTTVNAAKNVTETSKCLKAIKANVTSKLDSENEMVGVKSKANCRKERETVSKPQSKIPRLSIFERQSAVKAAPEPVAFSSSLLPANIEDIDENDAHNILLVPEFVNDIYRYLRTLENKQCVKPRFLAVQKEMTARMRSVLIDWIINVHHQFRLLPETLYLGVSIMDRFFQKESVSKDKIQLVGVTAFFIASKFEEIYPPDIRDFVVICDQLYHKRDILKMEMIILKTLKFELGRPLPLHFLRRNSKAAHADAKIHTMAKYLMELSLVEYECAHWQPSLLAATSLYLTLKVIGEGSTWTPTLEYYSGYTEQQLLPNVSQLCKVIIKSEKSKFQTCRKKYSSTKFMEISKSPQLNSSYIKDMANKTP